MCDLCAEQWVFVLATGRSGSTSIVEALNSLPGVSLANENQASLDASATLLERYLRCFRGYRSPPMRLARQWSLRWCRTNCFAHCRGGIAA